MTIGDFATSRLGGTFKLAYLVRTTITNLTTQDDQVECFRNVATHLEPGGCFVIEVYIPQLQRLPPASASPARRDHPRVHRYPNASRLRRVTTSRRKIAFSHHYWVVDGQLETFSVPFRYIWPSELDLMARLAGMTLRDRWSDWTREPFTSDSRNHVSVWDKTA